MRLGTATRSNPGTKSMLDGQGTGTGGRKVLAADLGKMKEPGWGKSYMLVQSVPLELLLAVGTILYHTKALKR